MVFIQKERARYMRFKGKLAMISGGAAVKGAIIAFTKALALEVAPYNINVNCVSQGI